MEKQFTKADLKAGMLVEFRNKEYSYIFPNVDGLHFVNISEHESGNYGWKTRMASINDDLTAVSFHQYDIMKVWGLSDRSPLAPKEYRKLLWERKEEPVIKLTAREIEVLKALKVLALVCLARDKDDSLYAYTTFNLEKSDVFGWWAGSECQNRRQSYRIYDSSIFAFVQWKDEKPYSIDELLKGVEK